MSSELITLFMFATMMMLLFTGQRVFGVVGFVGALAALLLWGQGSAELPFNAVTNPDGRGGLTVIANSPRWQAAAAATYTLPVSYGEWLFRVDYSYRTDAYASGAIRQFDAAGNDTTEQFGEVGLWNARLALDLDQYGVNLALWGKNLANEEYYESGFYRGADTPRSAASVASRTNTLHPAAPRMYGVEITKKF